MTKKKFNKGAFRDWLDDLARACVKARDNRVCQKSGIVIIDPYDCQWAHIKGRSRNALRWRLENGLTLRGKEHKWGHDNPADFENWFKEKFPDRWKVIELLWKEPLRTWYERDYEDVEAYLLCYAKLFDVKPENMESRFRKRLERKLKND